MEVEGGGVGGPCGSFLGGLNDFSRHHTGDGGGGHGLDCGPAVVLKEPGGEGPARLLAELQCRPQPSQ